MTTLEARAPAEKPLAPTRLVLVEDNAAYARLVREMLRDAWPAGLDLRHFERLGDAQPQLMAGKVDCVLLDLGLADAQGLQGVGTVQALAPELPVVVLTTLDDEEVAVRAVKEGAQDYLVKGRSDGALIARAVRYAIERKGGELELAHQAMHDALTGLPNRALFLDRLKQALTRAQRHPAGVAVLFLDVDSFKLINDGLGHEAGDALLVEFGERLKSVLRPSDTIARLGGDEFTILCDQIATPYRAVEIAERVAEAVAAPFVIDGREVFVTSSVGIALTQGGVDDPGVLLRNADAAMYRAKERGGGRYEIFDELMRARAGKRIEIRSDLHRALRRDEFRLHYQPQVHLGSGKILGVEALLRWQHPRRGLLTAEDFIAVAEESGLIASIGRWVLREACARLSLWEVSHRDAAPTVAVNVSPRELAEADFVDTVEQALADSGATPRRLCLEITERGVIEDTEQSIEALTALKRLGVRLAIDDFGTGQSSLAYLNRFPVDVLKIDRFFLEDLGRGGDKPRVVAGVIGMAHTLDLTTVAEGVEREEQVPVLRDLDCDLAQGFHFARALPAEEIAPLMAGAPLA